MDWRYKPGDKVIVARIIQGKDYYMHSGPNMNYSWQNGYGITITSSTIGQRKDLEGEAVTIKNHYHNRYLIDEVNGRILWTDDMFLGLADDGECYCESLL